MGGRGLGHRRAPLRGDATTLQPRFGTREGGAAQRRLGAWRRRVRPYDHATPGLPARLVLKDREGRQVDLHPLAFDGDGNGWQELGADSWGLYPAEGLAGSGIVAGMPVRCLTPELQLRHHLGWRLTDRDRADLTRLAERFGLPLPPG